MGETTRVGFIGVGLMGHGAAKNIIERGGYPLAILGHSNRQPVEDLIHRGAREASGVGELARDSDVLILCLPSSNEVEALVYSNDGILANMKRGSVLIDTTTADPVISRRIGTALMANGVDMLDAALGRTPKEAETGTLSTYVGGDAVVLARVRPIIETYADTIVHCGDLGTGTTCKLVNNSITIGMATLFAEGFATAAKVGVDLKALADVLSAGGADGKMWRMLEPWIRSGDDSHLRGPIRIAAKDVRAYSRMAENAESAIPVAQAVNQTLRLALNQGYADAFLPVLPSIIANLNGVVIKRGLP